jgi:hypothetical protein
MNMSTMSETAVSDWPTPHRLDNHRVETRSLDEQHGLARTPGYAAQGDARRRRPDEGLMPARQLFHACLVAQDRAAPAFRGGIDRQHGERTALVE